MKSYSFVNGRSEKISFHLKNFNSCGATATGEIREVVTNPSGEIVWTKIHNPTILVNYLASIVSTAKNAEGVAGAIAFIVQEFKLSRFFVKFSDEVVCVYAFVGADRFTIENEARKYKKSPKEIIDVTEE